jgi:hypothetical protein
MGKGSWRPTNEADFESIIRIYNSITSRNKTVSEHKWEWLDSPEGTASSWVIEWNEHDHSQVIGHHGLMPIRLTCFGQELLSGKTENTLVNPAHRTKILYPRYENDFLVQASKRFDILFTTYGIGPVRRIRKALGYRQVGTYVKYVKPILAFPFDREAFASFLTQVIRRPDACRIIANVIDSIAPVSSRMMRKLKRRDRVELCAITDFSSVSDEIDRLWEHSKDAFYITPCRTAPYLKWRIFDNPSSVYDFYLAKIDGQTIGYVITQKPVPGHVVIIDILAKGNSMSFLQSIITALVDTISQDGGFLVSFKTLLSGNTLNEAFKKSGFYNIDAIHRLFHNTFRKQRAIFLAKCFRNSFLSTQIADPYNWYFTAILDEGV